MDHLRRCQICGFWYTPPDFHRIPSQTCDRCYLEIAERLSREADFLPANLRRITYRPHPAGVKQ
jgi:hypothetical protein